MKGALFLAGAFFMVHLLQFLCSGQSASCSTSAAVRLYRSSSSTPATEGTVQICYSGQWYSVCDTNWDCADGNVVCQDIGQGKAEQVLYDSDRYYGSWSYIRKEYYSCSGSEKSLSYCNFYYYSSCYTYNDQAGVRCTGPLGSACSKDGDVRLFGGSNNNEGIVEYCYAGSWSSFCSFELQDAIVTCKQLGHYQTPWASILSPRTFSSSTNYSTVSASCEAYEATNLANCTWPSGSTSSCFTSSSYLCTKPIGIRCYDPGAECNEGAVRLTGGVLEQEGTVEVCVSGIWGSICGDGWDKIDGYVLCKQAGFDDAEPTVYTNSKFGNGNGPIVYSSVSCIGWEKALTACRKGEYPWLKCSQLFVSGVLCHDDCTNGDVRLTGGDNEWEGTVEVCFDRLWGTIADSGWDSNDTTVICRQLGYPANGEDAFMQDSFYGKPKRTVHFNNVACSGNEKTISGCSKLSYSLEEGKAAISTVEVAGVQCLKEIIPTTQPCLSVPVTENLAPQCNESDLRLVGGKLSSEGRLEFCYQKQWSPFCTLHHVEAAVACKQLGYTQYTWAAIITSGEFGTSQNYSLFDNITCSDTTSEYSLERCTINIGTCLSMCADSIGIRCFEHGNCTEGESRIMDGHVAQEGRLEICVNGVWGSICSTGWNTNNANVACRELGFPGSKPIPYYGFGPGKGPVIFSDVDCNGWESSIIECTKETYLMFDCPHSDTAGVLCADYCFTGEIRLVGGDSEAEGTVEICFDSLWGLIDESGWGLNDARVVCEQLGYGTDDARPVFKSFYGKPDKPVHASGVVCLGDEEELIECTLTIHSLDDARQHLTNAQVAGVFCANLETTPTQFSSSLTTMVLASSTVICQPVPSPSAVMVANKTMPMSDTDCGTVLTDNVTTTLYTTLQTTGTTTAYSTTTSVSETTVNATSFTTVTNTVSLVETLTTTSLITSTTSSTIYSTLTSTSTSTKISSSTVTLISTSTSTQVGTTTVTSTATEPASTTIYATATEISTTTTTKVSTLTNTETSTSTTTETTTTTETKTSIPSATETFTITANATSVATATSTSTTTVYITNGEPPLTCSVTPPTTAGNQREDNTRQTQSADVAGADSDSSSSSGSSSTLLVVVVIVFILIAAVVVIGVIAVVVMVRKQSKRQVPHTSTHSLPLPADTLQTTFPPSYYASHGTDCEDLEKKILEEVKEERESKHEDDGDSLETSIPPEHSGDEAGM